MGFLMVLIFLSTGNPRAGFAVGSIPTITMQVNGTYTMSEWTVLGEAIAFTVPYPVKATVNAQIQGAPPNTAFSVIFSATSNGCPQGEIKAGGQCYPDYPSDSTFSFSEEILQENGQAWKVQPLVYYGPGGQYAVSGRITVTFSRIFKPLPPLRIIKVTSPAANAVFAAGTKINVAWISKGKVGDSVKIRVVPEIEPQAAQVVVANTPNDGAFTWLRAAFFPGKVWLEVQSLDGKVTGKSGLFTIQR